MRTEMPERSLDEAVQHVEQMRDDVKAALDQWQRERQEYLKKLDQENAAYMAGAKTRADTIMTRTERAFGAVYLAIVFALGLFVGAFGMYVIVTKWL